MSRPTGYELSDFAHRGLWESVAVGTVRDRFNIRTEFTDFLKKKGYVNMLAEEFAESNVGLLLTKVLQTCDQWEALGIPRPLHVVDQQGTIVTWRHPNYETISGRERLPIQFCDVWQWVKNLRERDFLFSCAAYLFELGCNRIFITDTTGDGGVDLIGVHDSGTFKGMCFVVQAKTSVSDISKETLFSDYTKFLLLRYNAKWIEYQKALGIDKASDGIGVIYVFASNIEFNSAIIQAARDLPIMLRSGRQIAHCLSKKADLGKWHAVRDMMGPNEASLTRNVWITFSKSF